MGMEYCLYYVPGKARSCMGKALQKTGFFLCNNLHLYTCYIRQVDDAKELAIGGQIPLNWKTQFLL